MTSKVKVLSLYRSLLRESQKFTSYNFRMYAIRRTRDAFKENKMLNNQNSINKEFEFGLKNLETIKRQVLVGNMYSTDKLVIEK